MKITRKDYRSKEEWIKARAALIEFNTSNSVKSKPNNRKNSPKGKKRLSSWKKKYHKYLLSDEWVQLKIDLFENRGNMCECCGSKHKLQVHHLTYKNVFQEEPEDLIILCRKCHELEHKPK